MPSTDNTGPFETERQARDTPAARAVYAAFDADPGAGKMAPHNFLMLVSACEAAGVDLGSPASYDRQILAWLAGWEPQTCVVIAGLITRASAAERQRIVELAEQQAAACDLMVSCPETSITGTALRGFADLIREEATDA